MSDVIEDLNKMIADLTAVLVCNKKTKEKILTEKDNLPMHRIFESEYCEDDKVYMITDQRLKRALLENKFDADFLTKGQSNGLQEFST